MRKFIATVLAIVVMLAGTVLLTQSPAEAVTCESRVRTSEKIAQYGFGYHVFNAKVYYNHCWSITNHYDKPTAIEGVWRASGYSNTADICDGGRVPGFRFNFDNLGGYNPAEFYVTCQSDGFNSKKISISSYTNNVGTSGDRCWNAHITRVIDWANDNEWDVGNCYDS